MQRQSAKVQKTPARVDRLQTQSPRPVPVHPLLGLQRSIGNQAVQRLINSSYIQTKLQISTPGDPYEQEADRVADTIMRMAEPKPATNQREEPINATSLAIGITRLVQRSPVQPQEEGQEDVTTNPLVQRADVEREGHKEQTLCTHTVARSTISILQRQTVEGEEEESHEEVGEAGVEGVVQLKAVSNLSRAALITEDHHAPNDAQIELAGSMSLTRSSGESLPATFKISMERAFGGDFGGVRIHTDATADRLSRSIQATAFTTGNHIYFRRGAYDTVGQSGRRLLAHELTHVVQQNPGLKTDNASSQPSGQAPSHSGERADVNRNMNEPEQIARLPQSVTDQATIQREEAPAPDTDIQIRTVGRIEFFDAQEQSMDVMGTLVMGVEPDIPVGIYVVTISGTPGSYTMTINREVIEIVTEPKNLPELLNKAKNIVATITTPNKGILDEKSDEKSKVLKPGVSGEKEGGLKGGEGEKKEGSDEKAKDGKGEGDGTGTSSGSEYGVFGMVELPDWLNSVVGVALKILGGEEELKALSDLLRALKDLNENLDEFKALFSDSDKLLGVVLGIEESEAINKLESWVNRPSTKRTLAARKGRNKGIAAVSSKVLSLLTKTKNVLRPIFKVRSAVQGVMGLVGTVVESTPGFEEMLELSGDKKGTPEFDLHVQSFAAALSGNIKDKIQGIRTSFKMQRESFGDEEFVTSQEVGRAVTAALSAMVPKQGKLILKLAQGLNLDTLVADKIVSNLIPNSALDAVNDQLRELTKHLSEAFISAIEGDLNKILDSFEAELEEQLLPELTNILIQPSSKPGHRIDGGRTLHRALGQISQSAGESLPTVLRGDMEAELGVGFGGVRVHRDAPAQRATEILNANAFTTGRDIFFAPGQYAPDSTAGRGLLAHELTHVVQQGNGQSSGMIQRDYKAVVKKWTKKFGEKAMSSILSVKRPGKPQQEEAEKILNRMEKAGIPSTADKPGKQVYSATNPNIFVITLGAYYYTSKGPRPTGIRRKSKWMGLLPGLRIKASRIFVGLASTFDPKARDRRQLVAAMGGPQKGRQAHHIIPLELRNNPLVKIAIKGGWLLNGKGNGIWLTEKVHSGPHTKYTESVRDGLTAIQNDPKYKGVTDWKILKDPFEDFVESLEADLKLRRKKL